MALKTIKSFPAYMYHKEHPEGRIVNNQDQAIDLDNKGWKTRYIWKEFPKYVNGIECKDAATEKLLLDHEASKPKATIVQDRIIKAPTGSMPDKPISVVVPDMSQIGASDGTVPLVETLSTEETVPPLTETSSFEIVGADGEAVPGLIFTDWAAAQAKQKELNANSPGHKARKI